MNSCVNMYVFMNLGVGVLITQSFGLCQFTKQPFASPYHPCDWYICLHLLVFKGEIWVNVGKYTVPPMNAMRSLSRAPCLIVVIDSFWERDIQALQGKDGETDHTSSSVCWYRLGIQGLPLPAITTAP